MLIISKTPLIFFLISAFLTGSAWAKNDVESSEIAKLLRGNNDEKYDAIQAAVDSNRTEFVEW